MQCINRNKKHISLYNSDEEGLIFMALVLALNIHALVFRAATLKGPMALALKVLKILALITSLLYKYNINRFVPLGKHSVYW